jgi:hypothetical protein
VQHSLLDQRFNGLQTILPRNIARIAGKAGLSDQPSRRHKKTAGETPAATTSGFRKA